MVNPFVTLIGAFFSIIAILIILKVGSSFFTFLPTTPTVPSNTYAPANTIFTFTGAIYDNSFIFFMIIFTVIDLAVTWLKPNIGMGIVNFMFIFFLAYFALTLNNFIAPINSALSFNSLLPNTYSYFTNGYYIVLTFFALILCTVFNFRKVEKSGG